MIGLLRAEWLKTKRTALRPLVFFAPFAMGGVLAWYVAGRPWIAPGTAFSGFFSVWAVLVLPLGLAVCAGQLVQEEEEAASLHGLLLCTRPRAVCYLTKLIVLLAAAALATALAVSVFCAGLQFDGGALRLYAGAAAAAWLAAVPLAAFYLWLAFAAGMGAAVGAGMGGMLVAAFIGGTLLGDAIWPFIPWAWPVRLASAVAIVRTPGMDAAALAAFLEKAHWACALAVISGILMTVGGMCWFVRWDGRSASD